MAVLRDPPYPRFNFVVDFGNGDQAGFSEVILPPIEVGVIEYRQGNDRRNAVRKLPGLTKFGNLVLRRGVTGSLALYEWIREIGNGNVGARRTVVVTLLSEDRQPVMSWRIANAWPVKYVAGPLDARANEVVIEALELACEGVEID